ncbi:hypothetical protein OG320_30870 [Microbispora sp. NBC_01189]|uniref:hypothetical protein n=1 Tax=Microbispora sp. NBC_01189 TaxID=2903583 RepID=UPI002E144D50|nr:hypothetical protein OG320_30870 [Microbispora sp. NBC_01189]
MTALGFVLDDTVLTELGRADQEVHALLMAYDEYHLRMTVPVLTLAVAEAVLTPDQRLLLSGTLKILSHVRIAFIADEEESTRLADVLTYQGGAPDMGAAHAVAVAQHLDWPILTMSMKRWEPIAALLPYSLDLYEVKDPD